MYKQYARVGVEPNKEFFNELRTESSFSAKLLGCVKSKYLNVLIGAGIGNEVLT